MNQVTMTGRLTRDPELRHIPDSGNPVSSFTIAVDRGLSKQKKAEAEAKGQPTADFIRVTVWGKQAENCASFLSKGSLVAVEGKLQSRTYTDKEGKKVYTIDVVANHVEFLEWGNKGEKKEEIMVAESEDEIPF